MHFAIGNFIDNVSGLAIFLHITDNEKVNVDRNVFFFSLFAVKFISVLIFHKKQLQSLTLSFFLHGTSVGVYPPPLSRLV